MKVGLVVLGVVKKVFSLVVSLLCLLYSVVRFLLLCVVVKVKV